MIHENIVQTLMAFIWNHLLLLCLFCRWWCLTSPHNIEKFMLLTAPMITQKSWPCEYFPPIWSHRLNGSEIVVHITVRNGLYTICLSILSELDLSRFILQKRKLINTNTRMPVVETCVCSPFGLYTFCSAMSVHDIWKVIPTIWTTQWVLEILQKFSLWPTCYLNFNAMDDFCSVLYFLNYDCIVLIAVIIWTFYSMCMWSLWWYLWINFQVFSI